MKRAVSLFLSIIIILSVFSVVPFSVSAVENEVGVTNATCGDYKYSVLEDGTAEITDYTGSASELIIPATIDGYKVTIIGNYAFSYCNFSSVDIPDSVTSIGYMAFGGCESLGSIDIPSSVTSIGDTLFVACISLVSINIPDSITSIPYGTFLGCTALASVNLPESVEQIGDLAFAQCTNLTEITTPDSVKTIGVGAFAVCTNLKSINIPASVISIGENSDGLSYTNDVFGLCENLEHITVDKNNKNYDSRGNCNAIIDTATDTLIAGCRNTVIPDDVISIETRAFRGQTKLYSIYIPDSVVSIGDGAFVQCDNLVLKVCEDSCAHKYAQEYEIPYVIIGDGNISFIDKGMRVYSDSNNLSVDKGKTIKIGVGVIDSGEEANDVSQVTFSIADTSVVKPLESKIVDNVFFVEFEALKCGTTSVTFSDSLTGFTAEIPVTVYSADSSAFTLNSIEDSFDGYQMTSIAKLCGLSVDNYNYSVDEDTGEATLNFDAYNSSFTYGAVEVYNANCRLVDAAILDKYSYNSTSMKSIFYDNFCYLLGDVYEGNLFSPTYYRSQIRSKKTSVSVVIPEGGYIHITLDAYTSPVVNIANSIDLLLQTGELAGDLNGYKAQEKEFVTALTDKVVEDILVDAVDPAKTAKKLFKNITKDTFMTKETLGNFVDTYSKNFYEVTHSFDLVTDLAKGFAFGTAEEILLSFTGGYKYLFEAFFTTGKITELMVQYQDMIDSKDSGTVTIQNQIGPKRTNSDITVECKTNFTDDIALKVFQVTPDSDLLNNIKKSDPAGYDVIRNSLSYTYNISMIKNGEETQPQEEVTVYIPIPEELKTFSVRGEVKIYRMEEDGSLTDMNAKVEGEYLVFNTTHFSLYSIVGVGASDGVISDMLDYTFETHEDGTATLLKYNGTDTEIAIPNMYDGYVVTAIASGAFDDSNITMVEIPDSISEIADGVFEELNCTIGVYADSYAYEYVVANELKYVVVDEEEQMILGDANGDGKVTIIDATYIQRHLAEIEILTEEQLVSADTYKDGKITILDATQIQRYLADFIDTL